MDEERKRILRRYRGSPDARLSSGMEAEVYTYGPDKVLKLYRGSLRLTDLHLLRDFYNSLDRQLLPYAIPRVYMIDQEDRFLITIENRLPGTRLASVLSSLTTDELYQMMKRYLAAALA